MLVRLAIGDRFCTHTCVPLVTPFVGYSSEQLDEHIKVLGLRNVLQSVR